MPRKPRRCTSKLDAVSPPMTRSSTRENSDSDEHKMPALASLIAAALQITSLPASVTNALKIAPAPTPVSPLKTESLGACSSTASTISPSRRKRRKREPIQLPPGVAIAKLSAKDLRRLKNRIAADRRRQRSQEDLRTLQEQLAFYRSRCELLETIMSGCASCASLSAMEFGDIELLPAEPKLNKEEMSDQELDNVDDSTVLSEVECVVLDKVLQS